MVVVRCEERDRLRDVCCRRTTDSLDMSEADVLYSSVWRGRDRLHPGVGEGWPTARLQSKRLVCDREAILSRGITPWMDVERFRW